MTAADVNIVASWTIPAVRNLSAVEVTAADVNTGGAPTFAKLAQLSAVEVTAADVNHVSPLSLRAGNQPFGGRSDRC